MTTFAIWREHIGVDAPGIGPEFLLDATRDAVIAFCEGSRAYRHEPAAMNVVALTSTYTPAVPAGTVMWDVVRAKYNGREIRSKSRLELDALVKDWWLSTTTGDPEYLYLTPDRTQVRLVRTPSQSLAAGLVLELAVKPSRASTECPDWILEHHKDTVVAAAKWKLYVMKGKPWSDPERAAYHMAEFNRLCGGDATIAENGNTRAPLRSTPVW